jgi:hypothetical protein
MLKSLYDHVKLRRGGPKSALYPYDKIYLRRAKVGKRSDLWIYIPKKVAYDYGLKLGTRADVLYDGDTGQIKIELARASALGFPARELKYYVYLKFSYPTLDNFPDIKGPVIVQRHVVQGGIIFHIPKGKKEDQPAGGQDDK